MGDINSDYTKTPLEAHTPKLQFVSHIYQLKQLIKEPFRVTKSSVTTIDLIFTNRLGLQFNICGTGSKTRPIIEKVRNFRHFEEEDFINDLDRFSWQNLESSADPNVAWGAWKSDFNTILDHHAPIRHMRVRQ